MRNVFETGRQTLSPSNGRSSVRSRWPVLLLMPISLGMIRLAPGPMIPVQPGPIVVHVTPGGGAGKSSFRGVAVNISFSAKDEMRNARRLIRSGHLTKAINTYQHILAKYGNHLIRVGHRRYISIRDYVWQTLYRSPVIKTGLYDQIFGLEAKRAIAAAEATGKTDAVVTACDRYFLSSASVRALVRLSDRYFEAGHFVQALDIDRQLLPNPVARRRWPAILFRAAVAAYAAGRQQLATHYQEDLQKRYASASGMIAGKKQNLARALARVLKHLPPAPSTGKFYPASVPYQAMAGSTHSAPNTVLWNQSISSLRIRTPTNAVASQNMANSISMALGVFGLNVNQTQQSENLGQLMYMFPHISRSVLYIDTLDQIQAINANSGYTRWRYPRHQVVSNNQSIATLAFLSQGADQIYCTVRRGRVYGLLSRSPSMMQTGSPLAINPMYAYFNRPPGFRLVCLSKADGHLLWQRSGRGLPGIPISSPLVTAHGVFLLMASRLGGEMQARLSLVKFQPRTGRMVWNRYLCTISGQAFENPNLNIAATAGQRGLYIATNAGADIAVSQRSGRIGWLNLTVDPTPVSNNPFGYGSPTFRILPWKVNPPIITRRYVITTVSGVHHIWQINVYRRRSGRRKLSISPAGEDGLSVMAGVVHDQIILTGACTAAWNDTTGKMAWKTGTVRQRLVARPTLTRDTLYLPCRHYLIAESVRNGHVVLRQPWPIDQSGRRGEAGNLLADRHEIVAVNDDAIYSYARWKNALAYLNARIKQAPNDPRNYLNLAEAAYASGHLPLCQSALKQSLAIAGTVTAKNKIFRVLFRASMSFALRTEANTKIKPGYMSFFYSIAASAASTPRRQAAWRFAQARHLLKEHHPTAALNLCQQILLSRALRNAPLVVGSNALPAKAVLPSFVRLRIIGPYGAAIYKPWADQANTRVATAANSAAELANIAYGYANSPTAPVAAKALLKLLANRQKWQQAYRAALLALDGIPQGMNLCQVKLFMAEALFHMRHDHEAFVVARSALQCSQIVPSEKRELSTLVHSVRQQMAQQIPELAFTSKSSFSISAPVRGHLLTPAQMQPRWRPHHGVLLTDADSNTLRWMQPDGRLASWRIKLADQPGHVGLLGVQGVVAILITPQEIVAVNTDTGAELWHNSFGYLIHGRRPPTLHGFPMTHSVIEPFVAQSANNMIYINGVMQNVQSNLNAGSLLPLMARVERFTGPTEFAFTRLTRCGLVVDADRGIMLVNPITGKPIWQEPIRFSNEGRLTDARSAGKSIILAFGRHIHRLLAVSERSGQVQAQVSLNAAAGYRRILTGPDGTFFLVGRRRTSAYRASGGHLNMLWSRKIISPMPQVCTRNFAGLAEWQRDGLICLNAATGATRWQIPVLPGAIGGIAGGDVDLTTFDDTTIVRTPTDLTAYSPESGHIRWRAEIMTRETPPLVRMQLADPDLALLACGPTNNANRSEKLILINQRDRHGHLDNGAIVLSKPLVVSAHDGNGPIIQSWYVLDNSIIFSIHGRLFAFHANR